MLFIRIEVATSALVDVRNYLLDHSGDEGVEGKIVEGSP